MNEVARAWRSAQDPAVLEAFARTMQNRLRPVDREVIAAWVDRTVRRGMPSVYRLGLREALVFADPVEPPEPCWFPFCTRGDHHMGQHSGITEAGRELARLQEAIAAGRLVWTGFEEGDAG